jgi:hypothetical protein
MSYDRIAWAAPEWHTLMQAEDGTPSILAATFGTGRVLVIMPSFDREVPKDTSPACTALIRSFLRAE